MSVVGGVRTYSRLSRQDIIPLPLFIVKNVLSLFSNCAHFIKTVLTTINIKHRTARKIYFTAFIKAVSPNCRYKTYLMLGKT